MKGKRVISLAMILFLVVSIAQTPINKPTSIAKKKTTELSYVKASSSSGASSITLGGHLWFKTGKETYGNSVNEAFVPPDPPKTKYYVYICQRVEHRDNWNNRDNHIPDTGSYTSFNMNVSQAGQLSVGERTLPWIVAVDRMYWTRTKDPNTGKVYVVYTDGSIGLEEPDIKNTNVTAPIVLIPK